MTAPTGRDDPAFPLLAIFKNQHGLDVVDTAATCPGMTLHEYYVGQALAGTAGDPQLSTATDIAYNADAIADAAIALRDKLAAQRSAVKVIE